VPRAYGGLELSVPEGVRLEEELACIDGSLGGTVTLCAGANLFVGYVHPSTAGTVFADPAVCFGGSGQASGTALEEDDGYRVSGRWRYATGAPHLSHFTANCIIQRQGRTVLDDQGNPLVRSFFFAKDEVSVCEDWSAFGLKATASHSFEVSNLWVDRNRSFLIGPEYATLDLPIYRYPFLPFAEATLAVNTLGMTRHFLACAKDLLRESGVERTEEASERVAETRRSFYHVVDRSWKELVDSGDVGQATLQAVSEQSHSLVHRCREQVMALFPHLGLTAADASSEVNRIWRDLFTASQHSLLR